LVLVVLVVQIQALADRLELAAQILYFLLIHLLAVVVVVIIFHQVAHITGLVVVQAAAVVEGVAGQEQATLLM
jgi:hypothetical protein